MSSEIIAMTAHATGTTIVDVKNVVTRYTNWIVDALQTDSEEDFTVTYLGIVEMSLYGVNLGFAYRKTLACQIRDFCKLGDYDFDTVYTILTVYRDSITKYLAKNGRCTLLNIGLLDISDKGTVKFHSSCFYARKGYPIRSRVNPIFRKKFNETYKVATVAA